MRVVVTGASGNVGGYVVQELKAIHEVTLLDLKPSAKHPELPLLKVDLTQREQALEAIKDFDAVVHLAAIPNPNNDPGDRVLSVNVVSTYHVLEAMRENGIPRIVYGCSESASGFGIKVVNIPPAYLPIDEEHPDWPHESYSLSKYFGEEMCRCYSKAFGFEAVALRYTWVLFQENKEQIAPHLRHWQDPEAARKAFLGAYVFAEDVAQAVRLGVDFRFPQGSRMEAFYIIAEDTYANIDSLEMAKEIYGDSMPPVKDPDYFKSNPRATLFDIRKARRMLGYEPKHNCKEWL